MFVRLNSLDYLGSRGGSPRGVNSADMGAFDSLAPFRARFDGFFMDYNSGACSQSIYCYTGRPLNAYVDDAVQQGGWAVRELHGIEDGSWGTVSLADYRSHLDYVVSKIQANQLWMATFTDVTRYRSSRAYCGNAYIEDDSILFSQSTSTGCTKYSTPLSLIVNASSTNFSGASQNGVAVPMTALGSGRFMLEVDPAGGPAYFASGCNAGTFSLPTNTWRQISLPCDLGVGRNVVDTFAGSNLGEYGSDWVLYKFDSTSAAYSMVNAGDGLNQSNGYWMVQMTGSTKTLSMPSDSEDTTAYAITGCPSGKTCFEVPLYGHNSEVQWNLVSYPFSAPASLESARVVGPVAACGNGCTLNEALAADVFHNELWTFDGTNYLKVVGSNNVSPWSGYWSATLGGVDSPSLLFQKP